MIKQIAEAIRYKRNYNRELLLEEMPDEIRKIGEGSCWKTGTFTGAGGNVLTWNGVSKKPVRCAIFLDNNQTIRITGEEEDMRRFLVYADTYSGVVFHLDTDDLYVYRTKASYTPITIAYDEANKKATFTLGNVLKFCSGKTYRLVYSEY